MNMNQFGISSFWVGCVIFLSFYHLIFSKAFNHRPDIIFDINCKESFYLDENKWKTCSKYLVRPHNVLNFQAKPFGCLNLSFLLFSFSVHFVLLTLLHSNHENVGMFTHWNYENVRSLMKLIPAPYYNIFYLYQFSLALLSNESIVNIDEYSNA